MSSVPPSERVAKEIDALLSVEERSEGANLASELMRLGLQRLVQEALEQEVAGGGPHCQDTKSKVSKLQSLLSDRDM